MGPSCQIERNKEAIEILLKKQQGAFTYKNEKSAVTARIGMVLRITIRFSSKNSQHIKEVV
jgi:hypothetical protein